MRKRLLALIAVLIALSVSGCQNTMSSNRSETKDTAVETTIQIELESYETEPTDFISIKSSTTETYLEEIKLTTPITEETTTVETISPEKTQDTTLTEEPDPIETSQSEDSQATDSTISQDYSHTPPSYVPTQYHAIISDFEKALDYRFSDQYKENMIGIYDLDYTVLPSILDDETAFWWGILDYGSYNASSTSSFGYILLDISDDGIPELFLVRHDREIISIFTTIGGKVYNVQSFWPRYNCYITDQGYVYTSGSSGAAYTTFTVSKLTKDSPKLVTIVEYGTDGYNYETMETNYFEMIDGKYTQINRERIEEIEAEYPLEHGKSFKQAHIIFL